MTKSIEWVPPMKIEDLYTATDGNQFANINRPDSGPRETKELPEGEAPIQLYSLATPNGQKVSILLEELLEAGCDCSYDAYLINIGIGEQFTSGFTALNPNSKIPTVLDKNGPHGQRTRLFESGSICLYFAQKFNKFIPHDPDLHAEMMNWIFWQMGSQGPMSGQYGHFFVYAPAEKCETRDYGTTRYGMETQRLCDVLDKALVGKSYILGKEISLADIMIWPWFYQMQTGYIHNSGRKAYDFLGIDKYQEALAWSERLLKRPGFQRGKEVCSWTKKDLGTKPWLNKS